MKTRKPAQNASEVLPAQQRVRPTKLLADLWQHLREQEQLTKRAKDVMFREESFHFSSGQNRAICHIQSWLLAAGYQPQSLNDRTELRLTDSAGETQKGDSNAP